MIAILTDPGVGGTFLNWSIHYLAGHSHYYSAYKQQLIPVINNPLTEKNAHNFLPNQVSDTIYFEKILKSLIDHKSSYLNTIYFHNFTSATASHHQDTTNAVKKLLPHIAKTILLTSSPEQALYQCKFELRSSDNPSWKNHNILLDNKHEIFDDFVEYFFKDSKQKWDELNLKDPWDIREFLALNCRPFNIVRMINNLDLTHDHYHVNTMELWNRFDASVGDLFRYLEIDIDDNNFEKWLGIYQQWKKIHYDRLLFVWYFDTILDYVINGYKLDLTRFNLDICQEAAIQHALIYRHNLNLKTWQLKKFTNTRQLHELLEPNIHPLSQY
jgi:hypothetical protein